MNITLSLTTAPEAASKVTAQAPADRASVTYGNIIASLFYELKTFLL
ncbi:hypothetical protein [Xanthobacter versatilis]